MVKIDGVVPCSFDCLDKIRVEAGLLFYPYDMHEEYFTLGSLGVDFAISRNEGDFRGKAALFAAEGKNNVRSCRCGLVDRTTMLQLKMQAELHIDGEASWRYQQSCMVTSYEQVNRTWLTLSTRASVLQLALN